MLLKDLELYYFNTYSFDNLRSKYFNDIKRHIGIDNFFSCLELSDEEKMSKRIAVEENIKSYLIAKNLLDEFSDAYDLHNSNILFEFILQSLMADEIIKQNVENDIFLDKSSLLYYKGEYPPNIRDWKTNKDLTLNFVSRLENGFFKLYDLIIGEKK